MAQHNVLENAARWLGNNPPNDVTYWVSITDWLSLDWTGYRRVIPGEYGNNIILIPDRRVRPGFIADEDPSKLCSKCGK